MPEDEIIIIIREMKFWKPGSIFFFFFEISFLKPFALSLFCAKKNSFFFGGVSQIEITIDGFKLNAKP